MPPSLSLQKNNHYEKPGLSPTTLLAFFAYSSVSRGNVNKVAAAVVASCTSGFIPQDKQQPYRRLHCTWAAPCGRQNRADNCWGARKSTGRFLFRFQATFSCSSLSAKSPLWRGGLSGETDPENDLKSLAENHPAHYTHPLHAAIVQSCNICPHTHAHTG